jgi:hypothetical protein
METIKKTESFYLPISSIIPYEKNNRKHNQTQVDRIAKSIKEFGFNQPIVIDEANVILVGHGRLEASKKLKLQEVPVLQLKNLTETQKKAYRILDNKLQNDSEWDFDNINLELDFLVENEFDLTEWGLDELRLGGDDEVVEDDFEETEQTEIYIKTGDLIELGRHRVLCGDSTKDVKGVLKNITIDLVTTDPPYGVSYKGKTKEELEIQNDDLDEEDLISLFKDTLKALLPFVKDGGTFYVSIPSLPKGLIFEQILKDLGILRQTLMWLKDSMVLGHSDYHYKHEPILYGWKQGASHYFTTDRTKTSVLEFERPKASREHPTMKPLKLWAELILSLIHI